MIRSIIILLCFSIASGCLYRQDVQQGNEITRQMVAQISPGMTKREVIKVLGYPLINDPFNKDRWDYFYSLKAGKTQIISKQSATLVFEGDSLKSIDSTIATAAEPTDQN